MDDLADEVWRGGVNSWECDEMGHLNTRFYVMRAVEGLTLLLAQLGLPGLSRPGAATTFAVEEMHIRFHREARESASLRLTGGVLGSDATGAEVLLVMEDISKAEIKATFRTRLRHVDAASGVAVPWPDGFAGRAEARRVALPAHAEPRSTGRGPVASVASLAAAQGLARMSLGVVGPDRADVFGRLATWGFAGAVSDGIRSVTGPTREIVAGHADPVPARVGGAVLEFRILHLDWPRLGDAYEVRGGLAGVEGSVQKLVFWMLNPIDGRVYGTMESVSVNFDLDTRRVIRISDRARALLQPLTVPGLRL